MPNEVCSKCERRVGEEVLRCPLHRAQECPFVIKKISNQDSRSLAWSLILIGLAILYFTLPLARPEDYVSSVFVIIELVSISLLFFASLVTFGIGYIILRTKKLIAYDPVTKNLWEKQIVGGYELYSTIISNWKEYNFLVKFKPVNTKISENLRYPESPDPRLNQAIFLSNIILNLITQGYLKVYTATEYQVSGQSIDDVSDREKIYLETSKSLVGGAGEIEQEIYQTICNLQIQEGAHFAIQLNDLIEILATKTYESRTNSLATENNDHLIENIFALDALKYKFNSKYLEQEIYACLMKKQNTIWKTIESLFTHQYFRNSRVFIVTLALLLFIVLRFYLPLYRVEKLADKIDNQKVVDFVANSSNKIAELSKYLKDESTGTINFMKLKEDLGSEAKDLKIQALDALAELKENANPEDFEGYIQQLLNDRSEEIQNKTLQILNDWNGSLNFASADLINLLGSSNPDISYQAAELLGASDIDPTILLPVLRGYVNHQDMLTRLAVESAIQQVSKKVK